MAIQKKVPKFQYKTTPLLTGISLDALGEDGWELVGISAHSLWFKREK